MLFSTGSHSFLGFCVLVTSALCAQDEHLSSKVLILGAGSAGVAAGRELSRSGEDDFLIIEAQATAGGRVSSTSFQGFVVEEGANWVQAPANHSFQELVKSSNLETSVSLWDDTVMYDEGGLVRDTFVRWDKFATALAAAQERAQAKTAAAATYSFDRDSGGLDASQRVGLRLGDWKPSGGVDYAVEFFEFDFEYAEPPDSTSLMSSLGGDPSTHVDEEYFVIDQRGFFSTVEEWISSEFTLQDERIRYNRTVTEIAYGSNGVNVTCGDGSTYDADYAILTFSLGVLQSDAVKFLPELPEWKTEAIFSFHMVNYLKIFVTFQDVFWDSAEYFLYGGDRRGYYTVWQNLDTDRMLPGSKMLVVTAVHTEADRIEQQSDDVTMAEIHEVLRAMFGSNATFPTAIMMRKWGSDPLFLGTYSNWPIGATSYTKALLQAPVDRLFFSGEATSELYHGYVHGGLEAGVVSATDVIDCIHGVTCDDRSPAARQFGCTYSSASNFNADANVDDGSCEFNATDLDTTSCDDSSPAARQFGCTYSSASNFNADANVDDGSCEFNATDLDTASVSTTAHRAVFNVAFLLQLSLN